METDKLFYPFEYIFGDNTYSDTRDGYDQFGSNENRSESVHNGHL